jgi:hypothetical protein
MGQGERETYDAGSALQCGRAFLSGQLTALKRDLIVLVNLRHYRERSRYRADEERIERQLLLRPLCPLYRQKLAGRTRRSDAQ